MRHPCAVGTKLKRAVVDGGCSIEAVQRAKLQHACAVLDDAEAGAANGGGDVQGRLQVGDVGGKIDTVHRGIDGIDGEGAVGGTEIHRTSEGAGGADVGGIGRDIAGQGEETTIGAACV